MRKFADKNGDSWTLEMTFGAILRVKSLSGGRYDLLHPEKLTKHEDFPEPVPFQMVVMLDLPTLWEVLYMLVEPIATERKLSAQQFAELMTAEPLLKARAVFREEWRDFFRDLQRPDQVLALEKIGEWLKMAERKLATAMENPAFETLDERVTKAIDASLKTSFGRLEASSASIQDLSPGGNSG